MNVQPRSALVTGGAKRVGRAIVLELARAGFDVAIHTRRESPEARALADEVAALGRRAMTVWGDLRDAASWPNLIDETVNRLGHLDVLVNNAASFLTPTPDSLDQFDPAIWDDLFRTNVTAIMGLCHHGREHLAAGGGGVVINLCDIGADRPWPSHLAYGCSKAALAALTRGLARAMAPNVRVNGVAPGVAIFPESYDSTIRDRIVAKVPLARAGSPEEVARLVRFLAEEGNYITGQIINIDGGRSVV